MPTDVPLRVDFAGGWLDVPNHSRENGRIVNMAISPCVSLVHWPFEKRSGLGGSAAWSILNGNNPFEFDSSLDCGWQDGAVIREGGLCIWQSGRKPKLISKSSGAWLSGLLAISYIEERVLPIETIARLLRDYFLIEQASLQAEDAVMQSDLRQLAIAMVMSYTAQRMEGMKRLPHHGVAYKYCGAGWGGYALYLFASKEKRDYSIKAHGMLAIEPFISTPSHGT